MDNPDYLNQLLQIIKAASNSITQAFEGINHFISAFARIGRMADNELKVTEAPQKLEGIAQIKQLAKEEMFKMIFKPVALHP